MYLQKLNNKWSAYMERSGFKQDVRITNTTKLNVVAGSYMLEFVHHGKRYHVYHILGESLYELRELNSAYNQSSFETVFGINEERAKPFIEMVTDSPIPTGSNLDLIAR